MAQSSLFDDVADFGRQLLGDNHSRQALRLYAWQLSSICDLISHTHSIVIDGLDVIEETNSLEEAKILAKDLERDPLTYSFRVNGLCDIFEGYGIALRKAVNWTDDPNPPENKLVATTDEQWNTWMAFCDALEDSEDEVASLYGDEIRELGDMLLGVDAVTDLNEIKAKAGRARAVLTAQRAEFDSLATQFKQSLPG
jgi:hypothetical protein